MLAFLLNTFGMYDGHWPDEIFPINTHLFILASSLRGIHPNVSNSLTLLALVSSPSITRDALFWILMTFCKFSIEQVVHKRGEIHHYLFSESVIVKFALRKRQKSFNFP